MKFMSTVGKLRKLIADLPDDAPVVVPGHDHSFYEPQSYLRTIVIEEGETLTEDHDSVPGERVKALVVG